MIKTLVVFFLLLSTNNIYLSSNSTLSVNSIWSPSPDVVAVAPAVDKFWSAFWRGVRNQLEGHGGGSVMLFYEGWRIDDGRLVEHGWISNWLRIGRISGHGIRNWLVSSRLVDVWLEDGVGDEVHRSAFRHGEEGLWHTLCAAPVDRWISLDGFTIIS